MAFLTEQDKKYRTPEDICTHLGDEYDKFSGAIVPPIFQNSLFVNPTDVNAVLPHGHSYTRVSNPTTDIAERKIAALEGADGALCFSSGMGAISSAIMHFMRPNGHIVMVASTYGPTVEFAKNYLRERMGVEYTAVPGDSIEEIEAAIRPNTCVIYLESPSSMIFRMQDLEAVAALAKARGIGTIIDNSYATPLHQQPLKYGIDIVCHTASKYMGGHSDIVAGALASRRDIIADIQNRERALYGNNMDPFAAWLLLRGLRTLPIRLKQHAENAGKVVEYLENDPRIKKIYYPGSRTYDQPELFKKYLSGTNGLLAFAPNGTPEQAEKFVRNLHYFQNGCSWGGFESLAVHCGKNESIGLMHDIVRLHVGLESVDTLISDIEQTLDLAFGK